MSTRILFFPNETYAKLKLEIEGDGTIVRALSRDQATGEWVSAAKELYDRPEIMEEIRVDLAYGRWESKDISEIFNDCLRPV